MNILLIEDDLMLGQALSDSLIHHDYHLEWARTGNEGLSRLFDDKWHLVILDLGLPDKSGTEVLNHIRRNKNETPVLILTAKDIVQEKVKHLNLGADDYMVKPFDLDELKARINVLIRRFFKKHDSVIQHNNIIINLDNHHVSFKGEEIKFHRMEYSILKLLLLNKGKVVSRQKLEQSYDLGKNLKSNAVEVHIHHIRTKLYPELIKTIRGIGYIVEKET